MKTTIDHLPEDKQAKLRAITSIFTEPREGAPVGMLILFGSHARGDWVEDEMCIRDSHHRCKKNRLALLFVASQRSLSTTTRR